MNKNKELHKYVSWDEYPIMDPDKIKIFLSYDHYNFYKMKNKKCKFYLLWDHSCHNIELKINGTAVEVPFDMYYNCFNSLSENLKKKLRAKKHIPKYNNRFFKIIIKKFKIKLEVI